MGLFSEELQILDRNTVQYMIDEMQEKIDSQKTELNEKNQLIEKLQRRIAELESK